MNIMIMPGMLVFSSFLISVCMCIVSKVLIISSTTVIVCARRSILLNPFATVLYNVCSAVTVECCVLYPCCVGKEEGFSPVSLQLLRGEIWACMRYPSLCICWVWDGDDISQLPYVWYYVSVKSSFQHVREECESKRAYVFKCIMFSLSGPCELVFLLCFITSWT